MTEPAKTLPALADAPRKIPAPARVRRPKSVAVKFTVLVGLTLTLLLALLLASGWWYGRQVLRAQVDAHLSAVAASRRDMVRAEVAMFLERMVLNTDRGELRGLLQELENHLPETNNRLWSQNTLTHIADGRPMLSAALVDLRGVVVQSSDPAEVGRVIKTTSEFQAGLHEAHLGWPRPVGDRFEATLTAPVRTRAEPRHTFGVLLATVDVSSLGAALRETTGLGETGEAILGVRSGDALRMLFPPRNAPQTTVVSLAAAPALAEATKGAATFRRTRDYRGVEVLAATQPIGYRGWALVVKMDEREAYAPIAQAVQYGGLFGLLVIATGLGAALLLARTITRPVHRLAQAAACVADGNYDDVVPVESADELGALSASFNTMTAAIRARGTERDAAERALRQSEEALRDADRRKDEFLAMLGHELRNPLSAIAHAALLWKEDGGDAETVQLIRSIIERQSDNLSRLVDDLLDVARITEGKIELRRGPVEVGATIRRAMQGVRPLLEERRHLLEFSPASSEPVWVEADPTRLEQIVTNLLTNAIKYTPDGGDIGVVERNEGHEVVVTVTDNGLGIAPEMLPQVFELFTQAERSLDRSAGGLGIGLSLCRQLVALHGGTISAHSPGLGHGATFTVRLPTIPAPSAALTRPAGGSPRTSAPHRILLVDDNQDAVRSLSRLLTRRGYEVSTAADGVTALQVAQDFQPDVFLLDIGLPGLDGFALARRLRAVGFATEPIFAISGYAQESDRRRAREAGFDRHFAKPVDFEALAALLAEAPAR